MVLKQPEGGAGITAMSELKKLGTKYRIPFGVRLNPCLSQLVGNGYQDSREEKYHIPLVNHLHLVVL
tara:strand:+ start:34 stop:234 length:201 start_codon:yes stop_codon:yes gene_type:complete